MGHESAVDLAWHAIFVQSTKSSADAVFTHAAARQLFERVVTVKLRARQAKFFFKRWLELEKTHGNSDGVAAVKDKARKWVEENAS